jgi:hypothetical protein
MRILSKKEKAFEHWRTTYDYERSESTSRCIGGGTNTCVTSGVDVVVIGSTSSGFVVAVVVVASGSILTGVSEAEAASSFCCC